jgi:aminopeptidase N
MFRHIAAFELRYQMRSPLFWITALVFALLTFGSIASDTVRIGASGNVKANSPFAIVQTLQVMSVFAVFIVAAFLANVIVRDDETRFGPILHSTRISKGNYLFGRFTGAFVAASLAFGGVPLGMMLGAFMPWVDIETLGPFRPLDYLYAYGVLCLPSLFALGAFCFAIATLSRSTVATFIGVVLFLALYFSASIYFDQPELEATRALVEPFGLDAFESATKYWTAVERNTQLPSVRGVILQNRAIWLGVAVFFLLVAYVGFRPVRRKQRMPKPESLLRETVKTEVIASELPQPRHDGATARAQLWALARFDMRAVFRSPALFVLIVIGFLNSTSSVWVTDPLYGGPILPVTRAMVDALNGSFSTIALIVAIFYAGELVWRDREKRLHEIVDATPAPDWAFVVPKVLAISFVLIVTVAVSVSAGLAAQLIKGYANLEIDKYLAWYVLPRSIDMILIAVLAVFVQTLSANKVTGWGVMLLFIVSQSALTKLGYENHLYHYASGPEVPLSDMNGQGAFAFYRAWFRAYWSAVAVLLVVLSFALWRRGTDARLLTRFKRFPRKLAGVPAIVAGTAFLMAAGLGGFIFYNTAVLNEYRTEIDIDRWTAEYEKTLLPFENIPQPRIVDVVMNVDLHPHEPRVISSGKYTIENRHTRPIGEIHLRWDRDTQLTRLQIAGANLKIEYPKFAYRIYKLKRPMPPGGRAEIRFTTVREQRGFRNSHNEQRIVDNGTFLNNTEIAPFLGIDRSGMLKDRPKRRKYGLTPELRPAKLEDPNARAWQLIRRDSDWVTLDVTVSTVATQLPVAPGYKVSDQLANGRRTIRYRSDAPMMHYFSIQSAIYTVKRDKWKDVELAVYYDKAHPYNIKRMLKAMKQSLDYYSRNFSPYQFRQLRILEFPAYEHFAQAFANTIPYSEALGFIADHRKPEDIDVVTYVTAHETGHQWWAHQIIGADMQGTSLVVESLAQYSALMVMEKLYGPDQIRRFLKHELDRYLRSRGTEVLEEMPLERVESQPYIYYQKGSLALYLLKDIVGEEAVNQALRAFLQEYGFKSAPYPTSRDLIRHLRVAAGPEQQLVTDLFEKITLYDARVVSASKSRRVDGKWTVSMEVELHKFYANGQGEEVEMPLAESFDIGAFTREPGKKGFSSKDVLVLARQKVRSGRQTVEMVADREPQVVGIDPYNKRVDRNSEDNLLTLGAGS